MTSTSGIAPARLAAEFATIAQAAGEVGMALCVISHGHMVADLAAGWEDANHTRPWTSCTRAPLLSAACGPLAMAALKLVANSRVDLTEPVSNLWPEFARGGKDWITLGDVLDHRAGLAQPLGGLLVGKSPANWRGALEQSQSAERPRVGTFHGVSQGYIIRFLIERSTGRSFDNWLTTELVGPADSDWMIGGKTGNGFADWIPPPLLSVDDALGASPLAPQLGQLGRPLDINSESFRRAGVPSFGSFASARGLARLYWHVFGAATRANIPESERQLCTEAAAVRWSGIECSTSTYWVMCAGFLRECEAAQYGPFEAAYGHPGSRSIAFYDPTADAAVAFVANAAFAQGGTGASINHLLIAAADAVARG